MAKTIEQKKQEVEEINRQLKESKGFLLFGFNGVPVNELNDFRSKLRNAKGDMKVIKKRLFSFSLKDNGIDFQPESFLGQTALVAFRDNILDIAGLVYDFVKKDEVEGKVLGGYDIEAKEAYEPEYLEKVGQLPSKDILLGQVVSGISGPIRSFVYTLKAITEKG